MGALCYRKGGGTVIAAGLCLMGGCFAQDETSVAADSYWPAECVAVPAYTGMGSIGLYQYDTCPGVAAPAECFMETVQYYKSGLASFFYLVDDETGETPINSFINEAASSEGKSFIVRIQSSSSALRDLLGYSPEKVRISVDKAQITCTVAGSVGTVEIPDTSLWIPGKTMGRIRLLDTRNGQKDFFYSCGDFGQIRWFLLPMRSVKQEAAVYDIEMKTLVEF